jgi:hypothetical protein
MNWITIYITGKKGFQQEILRAIEGSDLKIIPGTTGNEKDVSLFWIDESLNLRDLKKAIGSKIVFKYRLHFYDTLEDTQKATRDNQEFTDDEYSMIREMTTWEESQKYKHSA